MKENRKLFLQLHFHFFLVLLVIVLANSFSLMPHMHTIQHSTIGNRFLENRASTYERQAPRASDSTVPISGHSSERKQSRPSSDERRVREHPPRENRDLAIEGTASLRPCSNCPSRLISKHAHDLNTMTI